MARYIRIVNPWFLELDNNGRPAAGYKVYTLVAGSVDTLLTTYSDRNLSVPNTNPVILNARGEAHIFTSGDVQLVYTSPTGDLTSPIWREDYVSTQQETVNDKGAGVRTAGNVYNVDIVPAYLSISDGFSLVMVPDASNLDSMITRTFTGTGINDCYFTGPYMGSTSSTFSVEIDSTGTPDTFKWKKDSGPVTSGVPITGGYQTLQEGVSVKFSVTTGHTLGDVWTQTVRPPAYLNFCSLGNKIIYKSEDGALTALAGNDIIAGIPAHLDYSLDQDCWILLNPSLPVLSSQIPPRGRRYTSTAYAIDVDKDWGNEVACNGTFTVTLPPCTNAAGRFYYITNIGTGVITVAVNGGTDIIIIPEKPSGVTNLILDPEQRTSVQLSSNGVDWHILSQTSEVRNFADVQVFYTSGVWTKPSSYCRRVKVLLTGPGGGGGGAGLSIGGSGGGGGSTILAYVDVSAVTTVAVGIGAPGTGGYGGSTPSNGTAGGNVTFGTFLTARGGGGGGANGGAGGPGGASTLYASQIDAITFDGYAGAVGDNTTGGAGGDSGSRRGQGGISSGSPGGSYGGGGAGGAPSSGHGGYGGPGICIVWW